MRFLLAIGSSAFERGTTAKGQTAVKDLFEHPALLLSGIDFSIAVGGALQLDIYLPPVANTADVRHPAVMAAIERIGYSQNGCQGKDCVLVRFVEHSEILVPILRLRSAVIARDVGDYIPLGFGKTSQLGILN
jgi:hypothetical protein